MGYTGQCNCGAVRAEISGEPVATRQCWCRQCQKAAAGGPTNNAMFERGGVTIEGPVATWNYAAASGNTLTMGFCPECGNHVFARSSARPQFITFRIGFLDEPHGLSPKVAIWTCEAPAWAMVDPGLETWPRQPPPPAAQTE